MLAIIHNLTTKTELFHSKKYVNIIVKNYPFTVLLLNQLDSAIFYSYIAKIE